MYITDIWKWIKSTKNYRTWMDIYVFDADGERLFKGNMYEFKLFSKRNSSFIVVSVRFDSSILRKDSDASFEIVVM
nr:MAG TPA: hypothetical protein [Caudoviricetes sp.]